jgi:uncharacterized protein YbjQ (UPF0145 family)
MSTYLAPTGRMVSHNMVTTQFELDGFRVVRTLGVVRGIVVRSRSIFGTIGASLQTLVGGNITLLTNLCEKTRSEAFDLMLQHAAELGGNAVVGARYDANRDHAGRDGSARIWNGGVCGGGEIERRSSVVGKPMPGSTGT